MGYGWGTLVGMGTFIPGGYGGGLASADLNADGYSDLVIAQQHVRSLFVRFGGSGGIIALPQLALPITTEPADPLHYSYIIATVGRGEDFEGRTENWKDGHS